MSRRIRRRSAAPLDGSVTETRRRYYEALAKGVPGSAAAVLANEGADTSKINAADFVVDHDDGGDADSDTENGGDDQGVIVNDTAGDGDAPRTGTANDPDPDSVEIAADWQDLPWPALRALGSSLSAEPVLNRDQAVAAVEAELARRAAKNDPVPEATQTDPVQTDTPAE